MKREELRIGNIVEYEVTSNVIRELHEDKALFTWIKSAGARNYAPYSELEGCPLEPAESWLEEFGFAQVGSRWFRRSAADRGVYLQKMQSHNKVVIIGMEFGISHPDRAAELYHQSLFIEVPFVHTLQNLWHALTGEELTLISAADRIAAMNRDFTEGTK